MRQLYPITRREFAGDLLAAGIQEGDLLVVHSAMSKVGWFYGGPTDAIRAIFDVIGPTGTLLLPTFTFSLSGWNAAPFDPKVTPSAVGVLTDSFWRMAGVRRSIHPTHSMAAMGPLAEELVGGPITYEPLGLGSPLDRARRAGAKILLLGVTQIRNSSIHVAESLAGVAYFDVHFSEDAEFDQAHYRDPEDGRVRELLIREMPGSSEGFDVLEAPLREAGIVRAVNVGRAVSRLMPAAPLCEFIRRQLIEDPTLLLQSPTPTPITLRRLEFMENLGLRKR